MGYALNRRQWLKTSALAVAGLMVGPGLESASFHQKIQRNADLILLNNNESPFGISRNAWEAITGSIDSSSRYPHRDYSRLIDLIAEQENISLDHIILGAGSTEVMVTLIHYAKTRGEILVGDPTYFDFIYYADQADCPLAKTGLNGNFEHDLERMEKQVSTKTGLVYICNPLNPTGTITPKDKLRPFCEQVSKQALVVVDEAYHEYADMEDGAYSSMIDLVKQGKNVIITRTFSKIFGLAGLRIGYGIAHPEIIAKLDKLSRNFAPVSWLSLQAAIASYRDRDFIQMIKEKNKQMRQYLCQELKKMGFMHIPSQTNFVLFQIDQDSRQLAKKLEESKILVRPFGFHNKQWIRVSCGTKKEIQVFLASLAKLVGVEE
jgi:histidinol-phosphate aminotransferase